MLPNNEKERLVKLLKGNANIFTWFHEDMIGINPLNTIHRLNVDPRAKLVKQKKWTMDAVYNAATAEEVTKLLQAGFIREIHYPDWLSNIVLVKKATRSGECAWTSTI